MCKSLRCQVPEKLQKEVEEKEEEMSWRTRTQGTPDQRGTRFQASGDRRSQTLRKWSEAVRRLRKAQTTVLVSSIEDLQQRLDKLCSAIDRVGEKEWDRKEVQRDIGEIEKAIADLEREVANIYGAPSQ